MEIKFAELHVHQKAMHQAKEKNLQTYRQIVHLDFLVYHVKTKIMECICY